MQFIFKIIVSALAVIVTSYLLPGITIDNPLTAIIVAAVLAFLNAVVKPLMIIFTIPVTVLSFGLFFFVINALIILLADYIVDGFEVKSFWWALLFSLILSIVTSVFDAFAQKNNNKNQ
ncbi:MAG: phage holin family protein [Bacteroidota bacterium]